MDANARKLVSEAFFEGLGGEPQPRGNPLGEIVQPLYEIGEVVVFRDRVGGPEDQLNHYRVFSVKPELGTETGEDGEPEPVLVFEYMLLHMENVELDDYGVPPDLLTMLQVNEEKWGGKLVPASEEDLMASQYMLFGPDPKVVKSLGTVKQWAKSDGLFRGVFPDQPIGKPHPELPPDAEDVQGTEVFALVKIRKDEEDESSADYVISPLGRLKLEYGDPQVGDQVVHEFTKQRGQVLALTTDKSVFDRLVSGEMKLSDFTTPFPAGTEAGGVTRATLDKASDIIQGKEEAEDAVSSNGRVLRPRDLVQVVTSREYGYVQSILPPGSCPRIEVVFYSETPGDPPSSEILSFSPEELEYVEEENDEDL